MSQPTTAAALPIPYPWTPDQRDGTYRNPILCADYSDPDVVRDGDDFYLTASSFNSTPGLPILHSRDLVNWTIINYALDNLPDPRHVYDLPQHGCGVWAPAIHKHAGKFYIFYPTPDEGIYLVTADDPAGKWSQPHLVQEGKGLIDPCPLWDDDGQAYLVHAYAGSRAGIKNKLRVRPMAADGSKLLSDGQIVFDAPERHPTLEGPKFHKRDGYYYLSAPAGGVPTGWQLILRSRNPFGPYEEKIVLHQGSTPINGPHQGAIVDTAGGESWFIHFQDADAYGRITHLQPVQWTDGWPLMGINPNADGTGEPVLHYRKPKLPAQPIAIPQTSDEFDAETLGLQWQWHANHQGDWHSLAARKSNLRLRPLPTPDDFLKVSNLLLQKLPARSFAVETEVTLNSPGPSTQAGLIVVGKTHAALALTGGAADAQLLLLVNNERVASKPLRLCSAKLRIEMADGGLCIFSYAEPGGQFLPIGSSFQATKGQWIGAKIGLFSRSLTSAAPADASADFDYFRFSPPRV